MYTCILVDSMQSAIRASATFDASILEAVEDHSVRSGSCVIGTGGSPKNWLSCQSITQDFRFTCAQ